MVGDARADYEAAVENNIRFVFMEKYALVSLEDFAADAGQITTISDLRDLKKVL